MLLKNLIDFLVACAGDTVRRHAVLFRKGKNAAGFGADLSVVMMLMRIRPQPMPLPIVLMPVLSMQMHLG